MQLSEFKTYVKYDWKRTDKDTELVQFYNDMIVWIASQMSNPGYKFQSYASLTNDIEDTPLPPGVQHVIHPIRFLEGMDTGDEGWPLKHMNKDEYDKWESNPNRTNPRDGDPWGYCIYGNCILLTPPPDEEGGFLEINWTKQTTDMSDDTDIPSLSVDWEEVLKQGTLERLYASIGLYGESEFWGSKYHIIDRNGDDKPVGLCKRLFEIEENREEIPIGCMTPNNL